MIKQTLLAALLVLPMSMAQADDTQIEVIEIEDADHKQIIVNRGGEEHVIELHSADGKLIIREPEDSEEIEVDYEDADQRIIIRDSDGEHVINLEDADRSVIVVGNGRREERIIARSRSLGDRVAEIAESIGEWAGSLGESIGESFDDFGGREHYARAQFGNSSDIDETKPMQPGGRITIENIAGKVTVIGWDKDEINVKGTVGEDVRSVDFDVRGDDAQIEVDVPSGRNRKIRTELTISVPRQSSIAVETVSAKIDVSGVTASNHRLETVSGSVEAKDTTGSMDIETVSGQITLHDADSQVKIDTVSGSVKTTGNAESVDAETVSGSVQIIGVQQEVRVGAISGSIRIEGDGLEDFEVETVSGSVNFNGSLASNTDVEVHTISGSVNLKIDGPLPAEYDLRTSSGSINCSFGPGVQKRRGPGQSLRFELDSGDGDVRVETFSGSITISD